MGDVGRSLCSKRNKTVALRLKILVVSALISSLAAFCAILPAVILLFPLTVRIASQFTGDQQVWLVASITVVMLAVSSISVGGFFVRRAAVRALFRRDMAERAPVYEPVTE